MASITVTQNCYWGGPEYDWAGLVYGDTVTIQNGAVCTIDPAQQTPTGIGVGVKIACTAGFSQLVINNTSSTSAIVLCGQEGYDLDVQNICSFIVQGGYCVLQLDGSDWVSNGAAGQTIPSSVSNGWTGVGFDAADFPGVIFVEESSGNWQPWHLIRASDTALWDRIGVGTLGRFAKYDDSTGGITFGSGGTPIQLSANATAGQNQITLSSAGFATNDVVHLFDGTNIERLVVQSVSGSTVTFTTNIANSYLASNSYLRYTKGGNIPPNGARVRVYNIGIASRNASGRTNPAVLADSFEIDTANQGIVDLDKCYLFGVNANLSSAQAISVSNIGFIRVITAVSNSISIRDIDASPDPFIATEGLHLSVTKPNTSISNVRLVCKDVVNGPLRCLSTNFLVDGGMLSLLNMSKSDYGAGLYRANYSGHVLRNMTLVGARIFYSNVVFDAGVLIGGISVYNCQLSGSSNGEEFNGSTTTVRMAFYGIYELQNISMVREGCYNTGIASVVQNAQNVTVQTLLLDYSTFDVWGNFVRVTSHATNRPACRPSVNGISAIIQDCTNQNTPNYSNSWDTPKNTLWKHVDGSNTAHSYSMGSGTHFVENRYNISSNLGSLALLWGNKTSFLPNAYIDSPLGSAKLNGTALYLPANNSSITYTWPHKIMGITNWSNATIVLNGSGTANFTVEFSYDDGSWLTLNTTNLQALIAKPAGHNFKIRISRATGSTFEYIDELYISTLGVDYENYMYPIDLVSVTLQNIQPGSRYRVYNVTTDTVLETGEQSGSGDIVISGIPYNGSNETLKIDVRKSSSAPHYKPFSTNAILGANGASVYISQELDTIAGG